MIFVLAGCSDLEQPLRTGTAPSIKMPPLTVAIGDLETQHGHAAQAVRDTFPHRTVRLEPSPDPQQALATGQARLALLRGTAFYQLVDGTTPRLREGAQAVGVVGYDVAHLIVERDGDVRSLSRIETLGIGPAGGSAEHTARLLLTALGMNEQVEIVAEDEEPAAAIEDQVAQLRDGELDAVLITTAVGNPRVDELLADPDLRLLPIPPPLAGDRQIRLPVLHETRIPPETYPGLTEPIDTLGTQVVLAQPAPPDDPVGMGGPGTPAVGRQQPLPDGHVRDLLEQLDSDEPPDQELPIAEAAAETTPAPATLHGSPAESLLNFLIVCAIVYFTYLYFRA